MCINCGCNGVTYPNGSDGIGITSITDNDNGTFTILMSDGSSFISPNYTGPTGPQGPIGPEGLNTIILFSDVTRKYAVADSNTTFSINPSYFTTNGDSIRITFIHGVVGTTTGTLLLEVESNGTTTEKILEDDFTNERISKIEILLSKSSVEPNTLKGYSMLTTTTGNIIYSGVTIGDYLASTSNVFTLSTNSSVEDSWFDTVTVELLKMID